MAVDLFNSNDRDYANAFLVKHSANAAPPNTIDPQSAYEVGDYRLFNSFGTGGSGVRVGYTPDPCNYIVDGDVMEVIGGGEPSINNGGGGVSLSGKIYQVAEGRIGSAGQRGSRTINQGRTVPWIYSVVAFDANANYTVSNHATFPTYYVYVNGVLRPELTSTQSTVKAFVTGFDASNENAWAPVP